MDTGVLTFQDLLGLGWTRSDIAKLLSSGEIRRVARGWYALSSADPAVVRAIRAGARVGCLTGCRVHGLWTPNHSEVHAVYPAKKPATALKGLALHPSAHSTYPSGPVWSVHDCVEQVARRHGPEPALIVLESAVNLGHITTSDATELINSLPARKAHAMRHFSVSQSGSETRVRLFFQQRGVPVRPQVLIPGIGYVDLLVGERFIVECDSREFHGADQQDVDKARDLTALALGYERTRLSFPQIWRTWPATQLSLAVVIRRRGHL